MKILPQRKDKYVKLADVYAKIAHVADMDVKDPLPILRDKIGDLPTIEGESQKLLVKAGIRTLETMEVTVATGVQIACELDD